MKSILTIVLITMLSLISINTIGQENSEIEYIKFELQHSKKIPYFKVIIEMTINKNVTTIHIVSTPKTEDKKWAYSKIDKTFSTDTKKFEDLIKSITDLKKNDFSKATLDGKDGIICILEFGTINNPKVYKFWSPDYETDKRGLTEYWSVCNKLVELVGLNTDEIY